MIIKCAIVGLPNIGKSTLFNSLTNSNVKAENFPFCTINPNEKIILLKDNKIKKISKLLKINKIIYSKLIITDIAGLIKGSCKGYGLGNKFLNNIKNSDIILHVIKCFYDKNITHLYHGLNLNPIKDIDIINLELILFDITICEEIIFNKKIDKNIFFEEKIKIVKKCFVCLKKNNLLSSINLTNKEKIIISDLNFLTLKPMLYILNINDNINCKNEILSIEDFLKNKNIKYLKICANFIFNKCYFLNKEEYKKTFIKNFIFYIYEKLNICTYYTYNKNEISSNISNININILDAANKIHSDMKNGFIRAKVISYLDFIKYENLKKLKLNGKIKYEGKNYIINNFDIIHFLFKK